VKHSRRISKTGYGSHRQLTNGEIADHAAAIHRLHLIAEAGAVHRHIHCFIFPEEVDDDGHCFFRPRGYAFTTERTFAASASGVQLVLDIGHGKNAWGNHIANAVATLSQSNGYDVVTMTALDKVNTMP
jgi:hypothetical protein